MWRTRAALLCCKDTEPADFSPSSSSSKEELGLGSSLQTATTCLVSTKKPFTPKVQVAWQRVLKEIESPWRFDEMLTFTVKVEATEPGPSGQGLHPERGQQDLLGPGLKLRLRVLNETQPQPHKGAQEGKFLVVLRSSEARAFPIPRTASRRRGGHAMHTVARRRAPPAKNR